MNRRDAFIALLALGASPLASFAQQQGKVWRALQGQRDIRVWLSGDLPLIP